MRDPFKTLSEYSEEMRSKLILTRERLKTIRRWISFCKEFRVRDENEDRILKNTEQLLAEKVSETEVSNSFRIPSNGTHKEEFELLRDMIYEMQVQTEISEKRMREIFDHISVCDHIKERTWQINFFKTARTLWVDIMRQKQESVRKQIQKERRTLNSTRKALEFTAEDRGYLGSLKISTKDGPSERKDLMKRPNDKEFLKSLRIAHDWVGNNFGEDFLD